jgi:hypothetical protein
MFDETREVLAKLDVLEVQVILAYLIEMSWFQYEYEVLDSQLGLLLDKPCSRLRDRLSDTIWSILIPQSFSCRLIRTLRRAIAAMSLVVAVVAASPRDSLIHVSRRVSVTLSASSQPAIISI